MQSRMMFSKDQFLSCYGFSLHPLASTISSRQSEKNLLKNEMVKNQKLLFVIVEIV